jgi:hypothetical protein
VSKETMREQVEEANRYHQRVIHEKGLPADQKMLVIWDVYCRHRDADLLTWIKEKFPNLILLFIPANLTELCQPLDLYFNALFKTKLNRFMAEHVTGEWWDQKKAEDERIAEAELAGNETTRVAYKLNTKIKDTKERFYTFLSEALAEFMSNNGKNKIREHAWKQFEVCFDHDYQLKAVEQVCNDKDQRYFKNLPDADTPIEDTIVSRFRTSFSYEIMDQHDHLPSREEDALETKVEKFVGRIVREWNGCTGYVESLKRKRASSNQVGTWEFTVKYYVGEIAKEKRARKMVKLTRAELMPLLVTNEDVQLPPRQQQPANEEVKRQQSENAPTVEEPH